MNYIQDAWMILDEELDMPDMDHKLMDLYLLLLLTVGKNVSLAQVHDAWSIWKDSLSDEQAKHPALIPFSQLDKETQDKDQEYADGIYRAAVRLEEYRRTMGLPL
jgi:hypothetical protein